MADALNAHHAPATSTHDGSALDGDIGAAGFNAIGVPTKLNFKGLTPFG